MKKLFKIQINGGKDGKIIYSDQMISSDISLVFNEINRIVRKLTIKGISRVTVKEIQFKTYENKDTNTEKSQP